MTGKHAVTLECSASAVTDCSGRTSEWSRSIQLGSIQQSAGSKNSSKVCQFGIPSGEGTKDGKGKSKKNKYPTGGHVVTFPCKEA